MGVRAYWSLRAHWVKYGTNRLVNFT